MLFDRRSRRLRRTARKFKKKTIDYSKYVKDFYIEKGVAFISCNVKGYYEIIDEHSVPEYEWLNHSFARFVEENAYYIPNTYPIVLEICGTHFSEAQQQRITETILDYYALQLGDKQLELDMNLKKSVILLLMGILFFGFTWLMQSLSIIASILEFAILLFWFFIWEFGDLALLERMDLREAKTDSAQLASVKVVFNDKFKDYFDDKEEEELFGEIFED